MTESPAVRPYRPEDREALDDICVRTAHNGQDSRPHYTDPSVFTAAFAAPYAYLEPELAFVLDDGRGVAVGYVVGAADTARFAERFRTEWLPLVAERHPAPSGPPPPRTRRSPGCCTTPSGWSCRNSPRGPPICTSTCCPSGRGAATGGG